MMKDHLTSVTLNVYWYKSSGFSDISFAVLKCGTKKIVELNGISPWIYNGTVGQGMGEIDNSSALQPFRTQHT